MEHEDHGCEATPPASKRPNTRRRPVKKNARVWTDYARNWTRICAPFTAYIDHWDASGPVTTKMLTDAWCEARGLRSDDTAWRILRNRLGARLTSLKGHGVCVGAGMVEAAGSGG